MESDYILNIYTSIGDLMYDPMAEGMTSGNSPKPRDEFYRQVVQGQRRNPNAVQRPNFHEQVETPGIKCLHSSIRQATG